MNRILNLQSELALQDVHPDLVVVVRDAFMHSEIIFSVLEGRRSYERQAKLNAAGMSQTMNSRHLTGHAVDLVPWVNGTIPWSDWEAFATIAKSMKASAKKLDIPIIWGGDWKSFRDGPHFELPKQFYP
ncbi:M15 family metallopeptidase [Serratia proteamaculans]|uniref:M15 family peptidase n=1 Tax=Serratia proteamaculans TaxID=28151 RepID=A0A5Q2V502_SERPR|nr:M15 family metallopeptidase [Serratia proteamaculans]QGH60542.1 M15 family peptidase [Serratia proteamaculans]